MNCGKLNQVTTVFEGRGLATCRLASFNTIVMMLLNSSPVADGKVTAGASVLVNRTPFSMVVEYDS